MIRSLLEGYTSEDAREQGFLEHMLRLSSHPDCCNRAHTDPGHFTASAFILSPDRTAVLLIEHSKLHRWLQPGGHVDPEDAHLEAAARREVAEETGILELELLASPLDVDVHEIPARKTEAAHLHFDVRFLYRALDHGFQAGSDAMAARWVPLAEVPSLESDESVWRAMRKIKGFG